MRKNYFMLTFNFIISIIICSLLILFIFSAVKYFTALDTYTKNDMAIKLIDSLQKVSDDLIKIGWLLIFLNSLLIAFELFYRLTEDKILNYFKSIYQTISLRHFLTQRENREIQNSSETHGKVSNPITSGFNRAARKSIVDIRCDNVVVFLKIPRGQQAQKILNDMTAQIKEEISNRNPEYFFSLEKRTGSAIWIKGTKR